MREVLEFNPIRDIVYFGGKTCSTVITQEYNINIILSMHDSNMTSFFRFVDKRAIYR
jgi:hypothetical protein